MALRARRPLLTAHRALRPAPGRYLPSRPLARSYNFASSRYNAAFDRDGIPEAGEDFKRQGREATIAYCESFVPSVWYDDPVTTILRGEPLTGGRLEETVDSFENVNGAIVNATPEQVDAVINHMLTYRPAQRDYRTTVRAIEAEIFDVEGGWPAFLVGNQALDFKKQDGVTEIEESVQANVIERRLNDQLLADEQAGVLTINRAPAYVGCVSNFSNFLDLCRKTLRNLELGVPVVVLSRSNTTQHMYRWTQMLLELADKHGLDKAMVSYLAAPKEEQARTFAAASPDSPAYFTCSRQVAKTLRGLHGPVIASTGGPNTLVATKLTDAVSDAIKLSATIENSGQCTALRHAVVGCTEADVERMLSDVAVVSSSSDALRKGEFAGLFDFADKVFKKVDGYKFHAGNASVAYRLSHSLPPDDIEEQWRNVYVDVTSPADATDPQFVDDLSRWVVTHQPITLAVNAEEGNYALAQKLFLQTGQVVFTVGTLDDPGLTCQARPQDGEIFGEFPPRHELGQHTKFPVLVPTPTPAYNSSYTPAYLAGQGRGWDAAGLPLPAVSIAAQVETDEVRGYLRTTTEYLTDVCTENPRRGSGSRTTLFGLQTTPRNGQRNVFRCEADTSLDELAPYLFPFVITNAHDTVRVSVHPDNTPLLSALQTAGIEGTTAEDAAAFEARVASEKPYNVLRPGVQTTYPLVGQFVSCLLCVGHIKSVKQNDEAFVNAFISSPKWLAMRS